MTEVKCVVWDLDNTIWSGVLPEQKEVKLKPEMREIITKLDSRGIINSIASKNNHNDAIEQLRKFNLAEFFIYPEINWNAKSNSIKNIQKNLNIGIDTIVFIDDDPYELDEVSQSLSLVECINANECAKILELERFKPKFITEDSSRRRLMYLEDLKRNKDEQEYSGPKEEFLSSLNMKFIISEAREEDLKRAEELTIRTNQLNATGITYDYFQLNEFRKSNNYLLLVCELEDKYGSYGKIGLALIEMKEDTWYLKMLLMSCRVMSRGVGTILLSFVLKEAKKRHKKFHADFRHTDKNKMMYITFRFANFKEISNKGNGNVLLENDLSLIQEYPSYIKLEIPFLNKL